MELLVLGGDLRFTHLVRCACSRGIEAYGVACPMQEPLLPQSRQADMERITRAEHLLMPNPWSTGFALPQGERRITAEEIFNRLTPGATMLVTGTQGMPDNFERTYHVRVIDLMKNEAYLLANAVLTAEGALCSAMQKTGCALCASRCLLIGYGRIAQALARMLAGLGADVTVCARREAVRVQIRNDGYKAAGMDSLALLLGGMRFIFSTPPERVLDDALLAQVQPDALLMELASPPYGFDLPRALELGVHAVREPALPGRYCPISAAAVLLDAVFAALNSDRKELSSHE